MVIEGVKETKGSLSTMSDDLVSTSMAMRMIIFWSMRRSRRITCCSATSFKSARSESIFPSVSIALLHWKRPSRLHPWRLCEQKGILKRLPSRQVVADIVAAVDVRGLLHQVGKLEHASIQEEGSLHVVPVVGNAAESH